MAIADKHNILSSLADRQRLDLELGCGDRKMNPAAIGVDALDYDNVDLVGDVFEVLDLFPDDSVDTVYTSHFCEHLPDPGRLLADLRRVIKIGGQLEIVVPHFSNPYYFSDSTHKSFYGLYTFCAFSSTSPFKRQVPTYQTEPHYQLLQVDLIFKSSPPFYFRHGIKTVLGKIMNLNNYTREFYEENLCYMFPCYEIRYRLRRI